MRRIMASLTMVSETSGSSSYSLASRRQRPSQPSVRSATQRRGRRTKPVVPARSLITGLPRDWGSGCGGDFEQRVVRGEEALSEAGAERAVVDGAADLEQPIGTAPRPAHLLRFVHATIDEEVGRSLGQRRTNPQPGPVPFAVVDQPIALPDEVAVQ